MWFCRDGAFPNSCGDLVTQSRCCGNVSHFEMDMGRQSSLKPNSVFPTGRKGKHVSCLIFMTLDYYEFRNIVMDEQKLSFKLFLFLLYVLEAAECLKLALQLSATFLQRSVLSV